MAPQSTNVISEGTTNATFKVPPGWWCNWKALKGTNPRHLSIPPADLRNKLVVITGGNSGIGREAALQFAQFGADIILGCREPPAYETHPSLVLEECKEAALTAGHQTSKIQWWNIDMADLKSVEDFGKRLLDAGKPIDLLINNAGMPGSSGPAKFTRDGFEILHQVNFLSHVLLTMTVLPLLAKAPAPRIICTTSCMQYFGIFDPSNANSGKNAYPNNKLYFQTWLTELQSRMSQNSEYKHIAIHGVHPGYVKTNIWNSPDKADKDKSAGVQKKIGWLEWSLILLLNYVGIDAQQGSLCITNAATSPEWGLAAGNSEIKGVRYANRIWEETPMPQTINEGCRRQIWEFVDKELRLDARGLSEKLGV